MDRTSERSFLSDTDPVSLHVCLSITALKYCRIVQDSESAHGSRMLLSFLAIHFMAMRVEAELFATLAPPLHLPNDRGGRTILVCLVSDASKGDMVITWLSSRAGGSSPATHSLTREEDGTHSAVSLISVATDEWDSYTCFVRQNNPVRGIHRHYIDFPGGGGEVDVARGQEVEYAGVEIDVPDLQLLLALGHGAFQGEATTRGCRWAVVGVGPWVLLLVLKAGLVLEAQDGQLEDAVLVDALSRGATVHAQLKVLRFIVGRRQLLRHADRQRQVAALLPHDDCDADVAGVDLHMAPGQLLHHPQATGFAVTPAYCTVHEGRRKIIRNCLVHLLVVVVNERPRPLNLAGLKVILESPKVGVTEQAAEEGSTVASGWVEDVGPSLEQFRWLMRSLMPNMAEWKTRLPRQLLAVRWVQAE
ncbi:hypothetical protein JZ751_001795 [Albula glossodonta]|uniref:Ig-like domain-containing protein n=1 Tax=Albula glossodonta TaxID=121402 RepID=A0A8T2PUD5_9TELE|nr:hypothetical protein JZ751_001795 [Albula glossodonta]